GAREAIHAVLVRRFEADQDRLALAIDYAFRERPRLERDVGVARERTRRVRDAILVRTFDLRMKAAREHRRRESDQESQGSDPRWHESLLCVWHSHRVPCLEDARGP